MPIRADYLVRETGQNLFRNTSLSIATILTVAVSLSLVGAALLVQQGIANLNTAFKDEVSFIVWMETDAREEQIEATREFLDDSPYIRQATYINKEETFEGFQDFYQDKPDIVALVTASELPTSFEVTPEESNVELIRALAGEIESVSGVQDVDFASDDIEAINQFSQGSSWVMLCAASFAALAAAMLMYNSIRTAVFARRREIEVMRLVGATKWFIRVPFMLEGLLQGLMGAIVGILAVSGLNFAFDRFFGSFNTYVFRDFARTFAELGVISIFLLAGALLGAVSAGVAVTRYLDA